MRKNPRGSVVRQIELHLPTVLKDKIPDEVLAQLIADVKELRELEQIQIATAFDDGRIAQKFETRANGKAYYRLNYYDENKNAN